MKVRDLINYFKSLTEFRKYEVTGTGDDASVTVTLSNTLDNCCGDKYVQIYPTPEFEYDPLSGEADYITFEGYRTRYSSFYNTDNILCEDDLDIVFDRELIDKFPNIISNVTLLLFRDSHKLDRELLNKKLDFLVELEDNIEPVIFDKGFSTYISNIFFSSYEDCRLGDLISSRQYIKGESYDDFIDLHFDCLSGLYKVRYNGEDLIITDDLNKVINSIENGIS